MAPLADAASSLFPRDGGNPIIIAAPTDGPYTTPSLTANLFCRVFLAIIANLVCLVPMRLLHRNSEFAAVVFILSVEFKNITTIVNSLIWRDDNVEEWYQGYGLCDMGSYFDNFANGVYTCCLLAIMRNLAQQVGLMRANPLSRTEKRRRNLVQALIIFPIPLVQVAMTWPLTAQRYGIGTLVGCVWVAHPSWPQLLVNVIPHFLIPLATSGYARKSC
jgi:pheromone a factor receptor